MVRASVGIATTPADISRFVDFVSTFARASSHPVLRRLAIASA